MNRAVVLLSGGLDSATCLSIARTDGFAPYALTVRYGQRHDLELLAASKIASAQWVCDHRILEVDLRTVGGSALTADLDVPKGRSDGQIGDGIPITYVPARNTIFLSLSLAYAEVIGAQDIYIGVNSIDYSGYPDCRPEFIRAFETVANLGTKAGAEGANLRIHTPLVELSKADIVRLAAELRVDIRSTWSCYDPVGGSACGLCDSCRLRLKAFADAGLVDPVPYALPS